jgi:hypothetical protein
MGKPPILSSTTLVKYPGHHISAEQGKSEHATFQFAEFST